MNIKAPEFLLFLRICILEELPLRYSSEETGIGALDLLLLADHLAPWFKG